MGTLETGCPGHISLKAGPLVVLVSSFGTSLQLRFDPPGHHGGASDGTGARDTPETVRLYLRKGHSETYTHVLFKVLAYAYFHESGATIGIEPNIRVRGYRPDLVAFRPPAISGRADPELDLWVECKQVGFDKLQKLARYRPHARLVWVHHARYFDRVLASRQARRHHIKLRALHLVGLAIPARFEAHLRETLATRTPHWALAWVSSPEHPDLNPSPGTSSPGGAFPAWADQTRTLGVTTGAHAGSVTFHAGPFRPLPAPARSR